MNIEAGTAPFAGTSSAEAAGVSAPVSIIPEKLAEHTGAFGQAIVELITPTAEEPKEAAVAFGHRLDNVVHSLDQIYHDANESFQSVNHVAEEAFRRHYELGMHFFEDLAHVRNPIEALKLQFNFFQAQFSLLTEQAKEMQQQFAGLYHAPKTAAIQGLEVVPRPVTGDNKV
jgi:hypothetical protein